MMPPDRRSAETMFTRPIPSVWAMGATPDNSLLRSKIAVVNIGIADFAESLRELGIEVVHVTWSPPAGGDARLITLLDKLQP